MRLSHIFLIAPLCLAAADAAPPLRLVSIKAQTQHTSSAIWSGLFRAPNGVLFNTAQHYRAHHTPFSGQLILAAPLHFNPITPLFAPLFTFDFDIGYVADIYNVHPSLRVGFGFYAAPTANDSIIVTVKNLTHFGGNVTESACIDSFFRQYHCGSGLPWRDYHGSETAQARNLLRAGPEYQLRFLHRF